MASDPDLSAGRAAVEALMVDGLVVVMPGADTGALDDDLRPAPAADTEVYGTAGAPGRCKLKPAGSVYSQAVEGGAAYDDDKYLIGVPLSAPRLPAGAVATLVSSERMPGAVGDQFVIEALQAKTLAVQAQYLATRRARSEGA